MRSDKDQFHAGACGHGVCGHDIPPLIGSILTGTGMTIAQAAAAVERGTHVALTSVQANIVDAWRVEHALASPAR